MTKPLITLASFTFRLEDKGNRHHFLPLDSFSDGRDLLEFIRDYLSDFVDNPTEIDRFGNVIKVSELSIDGRFLKGFFETGKSGTEEDIFNRKTKTLSYRKQTDDAMLIPHYFLFYFPEHDEKGVVFLQRFGQSGIQTLLFDLLTRVLAKTFGHVKPVIKDFSDGDSYRGMLKEASLKEVRFTQRKWQSDRADQLDGPDESEGVMVVSLRPRPKSKKKWLDKFLKILDKEIEPTSIIENEFDFMKPDEVSYLLKLKGKDRRISFADTSTKFRVYHDISDEVETAANGYPDFENIDKIGQRILLEISKNLYEPPSQN